MKQQTSKLEVVKVTKPIQGGKNSPRWIVRDINDSRVERLEERDVPKNVRRLMEKERSMFFEAVHTSVGWEISPTIAEGW